MLLRWGFEATSLTVLASKIILKAIQAGHF
jgi:hypothetical protein